MIEGERAAQEAAAADALRSALLAFWIAREPNTRPDAGALAAWADLRRAFAGRSIELPQVPDDDSSLVALLNGIASAKEGRPVGWGFRHLIQVGHRIGDAYKQHVAAFGHALLHFGTADLVDRQDRSGKWKERRQIMRRSLERGEPDYLPDRATLALVGLLMPGVHEKLEKLALKEPA